MRKGWRAFAIFMAMVMVIAFLPTAAFAQDDGAVSDDAILDAENAVEGFDAPETQEDDASDETDTVGDVGNMTEVDDSFGGFAGDDEFLVDDEFAEDELPVEDEVSTEDSELAEDIAEAGIMLLSSGQRALERGKVTVEFADKLTGNKLLGGKDFIIEDYKNTTVTAETLAQNGIDLTKYTIMSCSMTVTKGSTTSEQQAPEFIEAKKGSWHEVSYKFFVISESDPPGATITLDILFVEDKEDGTEAEILSRPEGYAIGYTAKLSGEWDFPENKSCDVSGKITLNNPEYVVNGEYFSRITFDNPVNLKMPGYEYKKVEMSASKDSTGIWILGNNSYEVTNGTGANDSATLTVVNHYKKVPTYTVTWKDFDGNVFYEAKVNEDEDFPEEYKTSCPEGEPYNETYAFDGWNDPVRDGKNYIITSNWLDPHTVTIEGATTQRVKHNTTATKPSYEPTKEGHTFGGWWLAEKNESGEWVIVGETAFDWSTKITKDITLVVNWIPEKRTVTWMNGETEVTKTEVDYGTAATAPELTAPEGYRLAGWTIAGEGGTAVDFDLETTITENITLSAKWIKQVTHTWMDGVNSKPLKTETADEGAEVTAPANPTRSGYTFNGWTSVTDEWGNVTYTAQWGANSSGGGGTGGGGTGGGSTGGDNTGDNAGGDNTGGNGGETIGGGEGGEGNDPADENDPNGENGGEDENSGLVDIDDENTALGDRPFTFIDVTKNDWFYDAVYAVWEKELMNGTTATTFEPQTMTTRGMLVTILYRMEGSPEVVSPNSFSDVAADMYYAKAVAWAAENGIVTGYDDETFGPEDVLLREQTAAILYRYAKYKGMDVATDGALEFDDADMIGSYAQDAMLWAVSVGLINGVDENTLAPKDGTERSHMATLLTRLVAMVEPEGDTTDGENIESER